MKTGFIRGGGTTEEALSKGGGIGRYHLDIGVRGGQREPTKMKSKRKEKKNGGLPEGKNIL